MKIFLENIIVAVIRALIFCLAIALVFGSLLLLFYGYYFTGAILLAVLIVFSFWPVGTE